VTQDSFKLVQIRDLIGLAPDVVLREAFQRLTWLGVNPDLVKQAFEDVKPITPGDSPQ
jgi:hypothetical protein